MILHYSVCGFSCAQRSCFSATIFPVYNSMPELPPHYMSVDVNSLTSTEMVLHCAHTKFWKTLPPPITMFYILVLLVTIVILLLDY